ncbi:fatty acyl-AMP ligase [Actinomadura verrucosospora]|uniref:Long-chain-fatty-acid--CoA ligase, 6-deoxyerythronolide-B synthase n=1 Tax=Actinomadura verrucosospora TaxID=46165 RepID=A0A7D3VZ04_ACTVE|nr:fatty acyl-AMP ligase [Actinomadura verrucosospora]QKG22272.1 Long-chain-fatty-acid--CoA ligase, 6-deoxyerythronolide-B synthase [Actinomadura verrucosospora]
MGQERHTDFVSLVRENVREHGGRRAFTFVSEDAGPGRSYREDVLGFADLDRRARALACRLEERGLRDRAVLLLYPEGLEFLSAFLGCLYARAVAVPAPLPALDAGRFDRTRRIIGDADIAWILTDTAHREALETWLKEAGLAGRVQCLDTEAGEGDDPDAWTMPRYGPDTLAFLQYTSGSTSDPKGVMVTHGNLLCNGEEIKRRIGGSADTVGVGWVPHYHDMGLVGQFLEPLYLGCRYVFTSPITFIKRPALWLELITRHRGTITVAPNFGYELALRRVTDRQLEGLDLASLRTVKNGAEPVRAATLERWCERFAPAGFEPEMWMPCYGMAETTLLITGAPSGPGPVIRDFDAAALARGRAVPAGEGAARRLVSSGRPVTLDVRIVDPDGLVPLPDGRAGEIWVRGGSVAAGYWRSPAETRVTFQAYTAGGDGPFLRTGDLGFVDGGELFVTGRSKDLIIVNGRNVHAHDVEETAQAAHPAALAGAAFVLDGVTTEDGREEVVLVQEISTRAAAGVPPGELAGRIKAAVARAHELPALSVVLTGRGTVRRTTSGKMQRGLTRQALLDGLVTVLGADLEPAAAKFVRTEPSQKHD